MISWKQFASGLRSETPERLERLSRLYLNTPRAAALISAELREREKRLNSCKSVLKNSKNVSKKAQ